MQQDGEKVIITDPLCLEKLSGAPKVYSTTGVSQTQHVFELIKQTNKQCFETPISTELIWCSCIHQLTTTFSIPLNGTTSIATRCCSISIANV